MPRQTEPNANNALGSLLQDLLPRSEVRSENTQAISGYPAAPRHHRHRARPLARGGRGRVHACAYGRTGGQVRLGLEVAATGASSKPPSPSATRTRLATPTTCAPPCRRPASPTASYGGYWRDEPLPGVRLAGGCH